MTKMKKVEPYLDVLPEPKIEFGFGQKLESPQDGLALFGPYDSRTAAHPAGISYGLIGTDEGIAAFETWSASLKSAHFPGLDYRGRPLSERLWPPYPGFDAAFLSSWPGKASWTGRIDRVKLVNASRDGDANKRAFDVVNIYLESMRIARKRDELLHSIICVVPEEISRNCRPESKVFNPVGEGISERERKARIRGQGDLFGTYDPLQYEMSVDFRRQLKARAMELEVPVQIVRESTVGVVSSKKVRRLTPPSDRAWNLSTAMYYKAGGKPWRLATAREGVCYVGIAFRKADSDPGSRTACCAAQMFLDSGDGVVFMGDYGPWYSPQSRQCHLTRDAARKLLQGVLKTYEEQHGQPLKEVFIHSRSPIDDEEFSGYQDAAPTGVRVVGIHVRLERDEIRLFRGGAWPVVRGTFLRIDDQYGYLWASGFKPRLGTYDGWEIPAPLKIRVQHGEADVAQVARDILGLTKLNYNACRLGDAEPVTVLFSDAVGEILVANPRVAKRMPNFKYYI